MKKEFVRCADCEYREGDENDRRDRSPLPYSWGRKGKKCQTCLWQVLSRNGLSLSRKKEVGVFR